MPKTGQTTCWDTSGISIAFAGAGQDGEWQQGDSWPSPRLNNNGNSTVTDNLTGLIWLQNASCVGSPSPNWANGSCGLTDSSVAGDWRLPNVRELYSLIDISQISPALPFGHPFIGVLSIPYWTSTTDAGHTTETWLVSLGNSNIFISAKNGITYGWPVRGGQ